MCTAFGEVEEQNASPLPHSQDSRPQVGQLCCPGAYVNSGGIESIDVGALCAARPMSSIGVPQEHARDKSKARRDQKIVPERVAGGWPAHCPDEQNAQGRKKAQRYECQGGRQSDIPSGTKALVIAEEVACFDFLRSFHWHLTLELSGVTEPYASIEWSGLYPEEFECGIVPVVAVPFLGRRREARAAVTAFGREIKDGVRIVIDEQDRFTVVGRPTELNH